MTHLVRIKDVAPQRIIAATAEVPSDQWGDALQKLLERVWSMLNQFESVTVGPPMMQRRPVRPGVVRLLAGFPVAELVEPPAGFEVAELPAGHAATMLHTGPYERLDAAIEVVADWCASENHAIGGVPWLVFWVTPDEAEDAREYRTEIVWSLSRGPGD